MGLTRGKAIDKILEFVDNSKASLFQMDAPGYEEPEKFSFQGGYNNKKYMPDAVVHYDKQIDIFSIETTLSKKSLTESLHKWILFSTLTKKKNGTFYLVVEEDKEEGFQKIINSKQISAKLLVVK